MRVVIRGWLNPMAPKKNGSSGISVGEAKQPSSHGGNDG